MRGYHIKESKPTCSPPKERIQSSRTKRKLVKDSDFNLRRTSRPKKSTFDDEFDPMPSGKGLINHLHQQYSEKT